MRAEDVKVGSFQVTLLLLLGVNYIIVSMNHALPGFHSHTPEFSCKAKGSSNSTTTCVLSSILPNSTSFVPDNGGGDYSSCETGYRFDSVRGETTIVTEWSLICEREYLRYLSTALYLCGGIIGAWIAGVLVDRVGRLPVLALCLYTQGTLAVALYIIQDYRAFLVVRALQGVFVQGLQISTYTLLLELFPVRMKTLVGMISQFALAIGLALLAGLSYAVADWRVLQLATSVPTAITVLYIWIIPESPRWLLARGKLTEAHMALEKIAKYNTCCRKEKAEVEPEIDDANVTTITAESLTPVKPKRKSRISNVDPSETKNSDTPMEEAENLLTTSLDSDADKMTPENHFYGPSEGLERRISNTESPLELDLPRDESKEETDTLPLPSAPPSPIEKTSRSSESSQSEGNQEVLPEALEEIVELRTAGTVLGKRKDNNSEDVERKSAEGSSNNQTFLQLFARPKLRRNYIVMIFVWFTIAVTYYGCTVDLPRLARDRHVNFAIGASLDLVAYGLTYLVLMKFGRRIPLSIYLILSGAICIVVGAISMPIHQNGLWAGPTKLGLTLIGKGGIVGSIGIIYLYTVEIFPTIFRGTGLGYCEIISKIGSMIAPQLVMQGAKISVAVPMSVMGSLCVVSGILSLTLPETSNKPLPDTIEQSACLFDRYLPQLGEEEDQPVKKMLCGKRHTAPPDGQNERDILRQKLFSDENGGKTWVDAGNGIIVNFSDKTAKNTE